MTPYTPTELRRIDALVAEHCFGWQWQQADYWKLKKPESKYDGLPTSLLPDGIKTTYQGVLNCTTDPAASDALDDWILERMPTGYQIWHDRKNFIFSSRSDVSIVVIHPDKKICRALFALKLKGVEV